MFQSRNHQQSFRCALMACAATMIVAFVTPAVAQEQAQPPQQSQPQPQPAAPQDTIASADVTELELEQFVKSALDVLEIQEGVEEQLASVQNSDEAEKIKAEANETMVEAIKGNGMEIERYNLIARSVGEDPDLKQRLQAKSQELRDESSN